MLIRLLLLLLALGARTALAAPSSCPLPGWTLTAGWNHGLDIAGQRRSVWAILPDTPPDQPAPLFIAFNGTSENGWSFSQRAKLAEFARRGFVVLAPSSAGNGEFWPVWDGLRERGHESDPNKDLALFDALLACAPAQRAIDLDRVYVGGHSAGGIFTNHVLQRRSSQIAGAIVASGVFSQTTPAPVEPLSPLLVLVTWGGDNDRWSGRAGTVAVRDFGFVAEASAASRYYGAQPGFGVVTCRGHDLGHAWLDEINGWMIDLLLAHPRGGPAPTALPPLPAGVPETCALGPYDYAPPELVRCGASAVPGCQSACQRMGDGAVVNSTVAPVLRRELRNLGFDGTDCSGCLRRCEALAQGPADAEALACMADQPPADPSVQGIAGASPVFDAVNFCCGDRADSSFCAAICEQMRGNLAARAYFDGCKAN